MDSSIIVAMAIMDERGTGVSGVEGKRKRPRRALRSMLLGSLSESCQADGLLERNFESSAEKGQKMSSKSLGFINFNLSFFFFPFFLGALLGCNSIGQRHVDVVYVKQRPSSSGRVSPDRAVNCKPLEMPSLIPPLLSPIPEC